MSNIEQFDREALAEMKDLYVQLKKHIDWAIEMINTARHPNRPFRQEMLRSTANTLDVWQKNLEQLINKQQ